MHSLGPERAIREEVIVAASVDEVWEAWTTEEGIQSFFAPACNVELRVDGPYEILFNPDAPVGERGAEGMRVMAFSYRSPLIVPKIYPFRIRPERTLPLLVLGFLKWHKP